MREITPVQLDVGTDSQTRPERGADVAKSDAPGVIRWCRDLGIELDEADQAWIRRWWGVRPAHVQPSHNRVIPSKRSPFTGRYK